MGCGAAGGGSGHPAIIRTTPPMSTMTARSITMVTMSTMTMTLSAPHYSQFGQKIAVSTASRVGSKGIGFPLEEIRENRCRRQGLTHKNYVFDLGDEGLSVHGQSFIPPMISIIVSL